MQWFIPRVSKPWGLTDTALWLSSFPISQDVLLLTSAQLPPTQPSCPPTQPSCPFTPVQISPHLSPAVPQLSPAVSAYQPSCSPTSANRFSSMSLSVSIISQDGLPCLPSCSPTPAEFSPISLLPGTVPGVPHVTQLFYLIRLVAVPLTGQVSRPTCPDVLPPHQPSYPSSSQPRCSSPHLSSICPHHISPAVRSPSAGSYLLTLVQRFSFLGPFSGMGRDMSGSPRQLLWHR